MPGSARSFLLLVSISCTWFFREAAAAACLGCVDLDELNFDKTIARFPYSIIKFDVAFPYGEKHEAFAAFSILAHRMTDELLIATVGIKDYGQKENKALGDRFMLSDKKLPGIFLFKGSTEEYVQLPSHLDVTTPNLQKFVMDNTPLYLGLEGCLKQFNALSKGYANLADDLQLETIAKAEQLAQQLSNKMQQTQAKNYITFMRKINEKGYEFVEEEAKRLQRLKEGKVSQAKKSELTQKLNVLESFRVPNLSKEEL